MAIRKSFDGASGIDSNPGMKARGNFLSKTELADLEKIARDGLEEHRIARRANAIILLNRGMKFEDVAQNLLVDDSTVARGAGLSKTAASKRSSCST